MKMGVVKILEKNNSQNYIKTYNFVTAFTLNPLWQNVIIVVDKQF